MPVMPRPQHVHMLSMHTSPLAQPGVGDAGGMNVYVAHLSRELAELGVPVTMWAARRDPEDPDRVVVADGLDVRHVTLPAGPDGGVGKNDLRHHVDAFADAVSRVAGNAPGQLVHAHYWLSGVAGLRVAGLLGVPLVSTLHTAALVKNLRAAVGEDPEPDYRIAGEQQVVEGSDALVVNTVTEGRQMVDLYGARASHLHVITPGIDPTVHHPPHPDPRDGMSTEGPVEVLMAARLQPLKGPGLLIEAIHILVADHVRLHLTIVGSGDPDYLRWLHWLVDRHGLASEVTFRPALPAPALAAQMRSADILAVPSSSETFGLVALEEQACATPVLASRIDGLTGAVQNGFTGILVPERTPQAWAAALRTLIEDPALRRRLGRAAADRAGGMTWASTAAQTVEVYSDLLDRQD